MKNSLRKVDYAFGIMLIILIVCLLCRCTYGFGLAYIDEFSQPAVVKRFFGGDRLLIDDWQPATTLIGYFIYFCISFLHGFEFSIIELRIMYVIFQVVVAVSIIVIRGWKKPGTKICAMAYLCSTPYGIMSICYNTVAIAAFLIAAILFFDDYKAIKVYFAGVLLAIAVLANPYLSILYMLFFLFVCINILLHKKSEMLSIDRFKTFTLGILTLFIPFCVMLIIRGNLSEYVTNIKYIFNDVEHSDYGIFLKFIRSQYHVFRVYWRVWIPLFVLCVVAFLLRKKEKGKSIIYILTCVFAIYGTIRFAFIYGSISINLMLVPLFFWGVSSVFLTYLWGKDVEKIRFDFELLLIGYAFAVCNYLATNTEILSMSSMFIISDIAAIDMNIKLTSEMFDSHNCVNASRLVIITFVLSLFVLRMTYIWGESSVNNLNTRIERGVAKGLLTSNINADKYDHVYNMINSAHVSEDDKVLILPTNALYYLMVNGEICSPYVVRFNSGLNELEDYYNLHKYKRPTKVIIIRESENEYKDIEAYFVNDGYDYYIDTDEYSVLTN